MSLNSWYCFVYENALNYWARKRAHWVVNTLIQWQRGQTGKRTLCCQGEERNVLQVRRVLDWANSSRGRESHHCQCGICRIVGWLFAMPCTSVPWSSWRWFFSAEIACLGVSMTTLKVSSESLRPVLADLKESLWACKVAMLLFQAGELKDLCLPHFPITVCSFYR